MPQANTSREQYWRRHIDHQPLSGMTIRDYCDHHQLQEHSFYLWRRTIAERDSQPASLKPPAAPAFLPVSIVDTPAQSLDAPIEIQLADGCRVRVRAGCDRALLADVLALLHAASKPEARPC